MDLDTPCIPLGHILTYFNIAQKPDLDLGVDEQYEDARAVQLNKLMQVSMGLDHNEMFRKIGVDLSEGKYRWSIYLYPTGTWPSRAIN